MIPVPFFALLTILLSAGFYFDPTDFLPDGAIGLLTLVVAMMFFAWHGGRMKYVSVDSDNLYVSGYRKSAVVPLSVIQYVHYSPALGVVILQLRSPSAFGSTIAFMPTWATAWLALLGQRSIVEELREMATNTGRAP